MNPYWVAYAHARGRTPDSFETSIANKCGFMMWINEQWHDFFVATNRPQTATRSAHGVEFTAWLHEKFPAPSSSEKAQLKLSEFSGSLPERNPLNG